MFYEGSDESRLEQNPFIRSLKDLSLCGQSVSDSEFEGAKNQVKSDHVSFMLFSSVSSSSY